MIQLTLSSAGAPCDELAAVIPNGSTLEATVDVIRRADDFSHLSGTFTLKNPGGTTLFTGVIEAMRRIGTHHPPFGMEKCDQPEHLEGWLDGQGGQGPTKPYSLRVLIVAKVVGPPTASDISASIDGALIECHN
jgi:hypothetical protein